MKIEMILFDMDGTLWDTVGTTYKAACIISSKYNDINDITKESIIKSMGLGFSDVAKNYMPSVDKNRREEVLKEIMAKNLEIIKAEGADIYDGVIDTIKSLSKKYKLGIITNNFTEYAKLFVEFSKLNDYFTDYLGASSLGKDKAYAIRTMLDKYNIKNAIYVGDTKGDKESSIKADVTFIHAKYGFDKELTSQYHIVNFNELEEVLNQIETNN